MKRVQNEVIQIDDGGMKAIFHEHGDAMREESLHDFGSQTLVQSTDALGLGDAQYGAENGPLPGARGSSLARVLCPVRLGRRSGPLGGFLRRYLGARLCE